jgi:hypothetical protein
VAVHTWVTGKRSLPTLRSLVRAQRNSTARLVVVVFSYGEIDCRCHAAKWHEQADALARQYVAKIREYCDEFCAAGPPPAGQRRSAVLPLVLAVPPASDEGDTPDARFAGTLEGRAAATRALNAALERACEEQRVLFTGCSTWAFAESSSGCLDHNMHTSGHVQARPLINDTLRSVACC